MASPVVASYSFRFWKKFHDVPPKNIPRPPARGAHASAIPQSCSFAASKTRRSSLESKPWPSETLQRIAPACRMPRWKKYGGWVVGEIHRNLEENIKTGRITALEMVAMLGVDVCLWENYHQNLLSESVVWIFEQTVSRCKCNTPTVLHMIRNFSTWGSLNQLLGHPANLSHSFPFFPIANLTWIPWN